MTGPTLQAKVINSYPYQYMTFISYNHTRELSSG